MASDLVLLNLPDTDLSKFTMWQPMLHRRLETTGQPVAKLSDAPGKALATDPTFLACLRQVFGVAEEKEGR